jgi:hypothetical protein
VTDFYERLLEGAGIEGCAALPSLPFSRSTRLADPFAVKGALRS